jgi:hypothetical protein
VSRGLGYRFGVAAALLLVIFALATLRTLWRGEAEMAASDRQFNQGEAALALRHARRAATAYVPGAAHVDAAYARLQALALGAERARDVELAAGAWRAQRSAALESRHLWQPRQSELQRADENLARLLGVPPNAELAGARPAFRAGWVLLIALGFAAALGNMVWFCRGVWTPAGRWLPGRARWPAFGLCAGVLVASWALLHA